MISDDNLLNQYRESKRIIRQAMEDRQLVLFVGAGASIASGMPSWSEAIRIIADRLSIVDDHPDYLRIPQYYYNARGKKEYTQLMREIFKHGEFLGKNGIHDKIIEFNTETIITTNYDHLIEQAAEDNSQILSVVSKDADLPYRKGGKELIKMHGDFENDNYVLKEDDYLSYSRNFKLIENYVKSLIGTKVVLFIGYSFNDPDLKLIFSWVKDILGGDFQRAYLIESGKAYDVNEADYFKNFGVNLLYASIQLRDKYNYSDFTNNLTLMLGWLLQKDEKDKLIELYNDLKPFSAMNYASHKYVKNALSKADIVTDDGRMYINEVLKNPDGETSFIFKALAYEQYLRLEKNISVPKDYYKWLASSNKEEEERFQEENNKRAVEYFSDFSIPKDKQEYIREILDILYKTNILCIEGHLPRTDSGSGWNTVTIPIHKSDYFDWMYYVNAFNYKALRERADKNDMHLTDTRPELYMEQGYIQFTLCNYMEAYTCFKNAKTIYYKRKEYVKYCIAEFDRYILGKMIISGSMIFGISSEDADDVKEEIASVDLDRTFNSLPALGESNKALKDIYTFNVAYTLFQDAYKTSEKVNEQAKTRYYMFSGTAAFSGMRRSISDYYDYITLNLLPVNGYSEHVNIFRIYFQSIVNSVLVKDDNNDADIIPSKSIHADELQPFDVLIALKFVNDKNISKLLEDISSKLPISFEALEYLSEVISNCEEGMPKSVYVQDNPFWKCLTFLGYCDLNSKLVDVTLKKLNELIASFQYRDYKNKIIRFLKSAKEQDAISDQGVVLLERILEKVLLFLAKDKTVADYHIELVLCVLWVLKSKDNTFDRLDLIKPLISDDSRVFVVSLYNLLGDNCRKSLEEEYSGWSFENDWKGFEFYYYLVLSRIQEPDSDVEKIIYKYFEDIEDDNTPSLDGVIFISDQSNESFIYKLLVLFLEGLIIDKESCRRIIMKYNLPGAEWLLDYVDYDYSFFDVSWLAICTESLLSKICKNSAVKNKLKKAVEKRYRSGDVERKILDLYFKYLT